jgi:hypothetical protein
MKLVRTRMSLCIKFQRRNILVSRDTYTLIWNHKNWNIRVEFYHLLRAFVSIGLLATIEKQKFPIFQIQQYLFCSLDHNNRLCGLVVKVPGYRSEIPSSIPDATRFSEN